MSNRLAESASPYLLQHADNPVDWYEWGDDAFEEARRRDVPLLVSIGYSACHWCHVMAHESFEDPVTADQMNRDLGIIWSPSQIQFVNPIMILCGIPIFTYIVYPLFGKFMKVTPLRKIGAGLFLTAASFAISGMVETTILDKAPRISNQFYADLSADLAEQSGSTAEPDPSYDASVAKVVIASSDSLGWDANELSTQTGTDIGALTRETAEDFRAQAQAAGLDLDIRAVQRLPTVTDAARVRQILSNLLSNAVKYTPAGRLVVDADLSGGNNGSQGDSRIAVRISDTGPGIPDDKRETIFQEFTRLDPTAPHGAGVGLAISRRIARLLGGDLTVESTVGRGSTFTLWIPHSREPV